MSKTVPYKTIQFSVSTKFSSIWPIDRVLSGATTRVDLGAFITGTSPSYYLVLDPRHSFRRSYLSAEVHSVYSTAPAYWTNRSSRSEVSPLDAVKFPMRDTWWRSSYFFTKVQLAYFTATAEWAEVLKGMSYSAKDRVIRRLVGRYLYEHKGIT